MIEPRYLILILSNLVLIASTQLANHGLSITGITLLPYGLLVVFPAIHLPVVPAFLIAVFTGLWIDASYPVSLGLFVFLLPVLTYFALRLRIKLQRDNPWHGLSLGLALNAALILALALALGFPQLANPAYWGRLAVDFVAGQIVVFAVARWFFDFQFRLLQLTGIDILEEELEPL